MDNFKNHLKKILKFIFTDNLISYVLMLALFVQLYFEYNFILTNYYKYFSYNINVIYTVYFILALPIIFNKNNKIMNWISLIIITLLDELFIETIPARFFVFNYTEHYIEQHVLRLKDIIMILAYHCINQIVVNIRSKKAP